MPLLPLLESFRNGFTKPSFRHSTPLVVRLWALLIVTAGSLSLVRGWAESQLTQHWDDLRRFVHHYA